MNKFNILVFPCGSEIGLEIHRSLKYSAHVNLIGANSVDDHGRFIYENYIGGLSFINTKKIISELKGIVDKFQIDAIYPTMDMVIWKLKSYESELGCKVISSNVETTEVCLSKLKTYNLLKGKIKTPKIFPSIQEVDSYPIFLKPDMGYGTRGTLKVNCTQDAKNFFKDVHSKDYIIMEYLPYEEFTIDCFTNRHGQLLFVGPRQRKRIMNGISVNTQPVTKGVEDFHDLAVIINESLTFRGAWFFQVKKNNNGELTLLEIASRLGGSSGLYRMKGVNFALLSFFDIFDIDVEIEANQYDIELDRALSNKYKIKLNYSTVYVDFDDCLIINNKINSELVTFLYKSLNKNKNIVLISTAKGDLRDALKKYRLDSLFDNVIHLSRDKEKYKCINDKNGIFIDDSFSERKKVAMHLNIPVFSPDMIECLI